MARSAQPSAKLSPAVIVEGSPKRGRILSDQRSRHAALDLVERADTRDSAKARRARIARCGPGAVVIDERARLRAVHLEAPPHRLFAIVVALHERLAGDIVLVRLPRRIELHVVAAAGGRMHAPA